MNRCLKMPISRFLMTLVVSLVWLASLMPTPAAAQALQRQFPPSAKRGMLEVTLPPNVLINGIEERLSPGARIKSTTNTVVLSGTLVGSRVLVNYKRDPQGQIHDVWILSPQEAQEERSGMETIKNFIFGSDADKPKTDDGKTPFDQLPRYKQN